MCRGLGKWGDAGCSGQGKRCMGAGVIGMQNGEWWLGKGYGGGLKVCLGRVVGKVKQCW